MKNLTSSLNAYRMDRNRRMTDYLSRIQPVPAKDANGGFNILGALAAGVGTALGMPLLGMGMETTWASLFAGARAGMAGQHPGEALLGAGAGLLGQKAQMTLQDWMQKEQWAKQDVREAGKYGLSKEREAERYELGQKRKKAAEGAEYAKRMAWAKSKTAEIKKFVKDDPRFMLTPSTNELGIPGYRLKPRPIRGGRVKIKIPDWSTVDSNLAMALDTKGKDFATYKREDSTQYQISRLSMRNYLIDKAKGIDVGKPEQYLSRNNWLSPYVFTYTPSTNTPGTIKENIDQGVALPGMKEGEIYEKGGVKVRIFRGRMIKVQ